jgi:hypothetical protein
MCHAVLCQATVGDLIRSAFGKQQGKRQIKRIHVAAVYLNILYPCLGIGKNLHKISFPKVKKHGFGSVSQHGPCSQNIAGAKSF